MADIFDSRRPYLKPYANIFINVGDTYFGSGTGAWNKYLDEDGNVTQVQKDRKVFYHQTAAAKNQTEWKALSKQTAIADSIPICHCHAGERMVVER